MKVIITVYKKQDNAAGAGRKSSALTEEKILTMGFEDGKVCHVELSDSEGDMVGNVYVGKVEDIKKELNACFVRIAPGVKGFLNASECPDGVLPKSGSEITVRVKAGAVRTKPVSLTMKVKKELIEKGSSRTLYSCLEKALPAYIKHIGKFVHGKGAEFITDKKDIYDELSRVGVLPEGCVLRYYEDEIPLRILYSLDVRLKELLDRRVWLDSGASLVIEHTEAFHIIDVNSSKCEKKGDKTLFTHRINLEAAAEAARQIRLRNLSGVILIDFISYTEAEKNAGAELKTRLMDALRTALESDPSSPCLVDLTPLDIAEITRRRGRPPLYELL